MNHSISILLVLLTALLSAAQPIPAQVDATVQGPAQILTLQQAIDYALGQSYSMKLLGLSLESARFNMLARKGAFKTSASMSFSAPNLTEQLMAIENVEGLPSYTTRGVMQFLGSLDIRQPLPTNGVFSLFSQLYQQDVSNVNALKNVDLKQREFFTSIGLHFRQPLFTINTLKLGFEAANLNYERTVGRLRRTELDVIYNVTAAFYDLYRTTRELEIALDEQRQQEEAFALASKKYGAGLIPEVEALQSEVDLAQSQNRVFTARSSLQRAEDFFKQTIGMSISESVGVQTQVQYRRFDISLTRAIESGLANRSEIRELEIERRLSEIDVKQVDARSEFKAELSAYYDLSGVSINDDMELGRYRTIDILQASWKDLRQRPKNRGIELNITMPLWDSGVNGAEVQSALAQLRQTELMKKDEIITIEREIKDVVARVLEAQNRLEILEKSQKVAERSYEISLARYDNGDITTQDLALDRERLTAARMAYLKAYIDYQVASADLKRKTLFDFEQNQSLVSPERK